MADLQPINLTPATGLNATDVLVVQNGSTAEVDSVTADKFPIQGTPQSRMSNPYKFSVYRNGAWTDGNGAYGLVTFDTVLFDTGSNYSTSTGKFTAAVAGFYQFNAAVNTVVNVNASDIALYKNGAIFNNGTKVVTSTNNPQRKFISIMLQLAATDYIQIYTFGTGGAGVPGQVETWFNGYMISAT